MFTTQIRLRRTELFIETHRFNGNNQFLKSNLNENQNSDKK
jgi:hypothetical protein